MKIEPNVLVDVGLASTSESDRLLELIRNRHSNRGAFDPDRDVSKSVVVQLLEAARWAPTPNNLQNFQVIVVDDLQTLKVIGQLPADMSEAYLKENFASLSATEIELRIRKVGMLANNYPPAWIDPEAWNPESDYRSQLTTVGRELLQPKVLLVMLYDSRVRSPGSDGDELGLMGLGCVMENMWLTAESLGLGFHILTVFHDSHVEAEMRRVLKIEAHMMIAFACSLGYSVDPAARGVRVRRELEDFVHHNLYDKKDVLWSLALEAEMPQGAKPSVG